MVWTKLWWETLGPAIRADVFPDGNSLFQQDNAPCYTANIVQEFKVLTQHPKSPDLGSVEHLWDVLYKPV